MASYFTEDTEVFTSKPVDGNVEVSPDIAGKFNYVWNWQQSNYDKDLINGLSFDATYSEAGSAKDAQHGHTIDFTSENDLTVLSPEHDLASATKATIVCVFKPDAITGNNVIFTVNNGINLWQNNISFWADNLGSNTSNTNCLSVNIDGTSNRLETASNSLVAGEWATAVISYDGSGSICVTVNGVSKTSLDNGTIPTDLGTGGDRFALNEKCGLNDFDGKVAFLAISNKYAATQAECEAWSKDIYNSFLRPAVPEYFPITYAATQSLYYLEEYGLPDNSKPVDQSVEIDWSHPLARNLKAALLATADGWVDLFDLSRPTTDTSDLRTSAIGQGRDFDLTNKTQFAANDRYELVDGSGLSIFVNFDIDALSDYSAIVACQFNASQYGWELRGGSGPTSGDLLLHKANQSSLKQHSYGSNLLSAGDKDVRLLVTNEDIDITTTPIAYVNGTAYSLSNVSGYGSGDMGASNADLYIGRRLGDTTKLDGGVYVVYLWDRELNAAEAQSLNNNPYQLLRQAVPDYFPISYAANDAASLYYLEEYGLPDNSKPVDQSISIDWTHPLARGLIHCVIHDQDLATGILAEYTAGSSYERNVHIGTSDHTLFGASPTTSNVTAAVRYKPANITADNIIFGNASYTPIYGWCLRQNGDKIELDRGANGGSWSYAVYNSVLSAGQISTYIGTLENSASDRKLFKDGIEVTKALSNGSSGETTTATKVGLFGNDGAGYFSGNAECQGEIEFAIAWDRILSDAEIAYLNANPYAFIRPAVPDYIPIGTAAAAGGATTVSGILDSISLTELSATVKDNINVTATLDSIALTEIDATVQTEWNITSTVDSISLTEIDATVQDHLNVTAGLDSIALTELNATVQQGLTVNGIVDSITLNEFDATVKDNLNVTATLDSIALTELDAIVQTGLVVTSTVDSIALAELNATIKYDWNITAAIDSLTLTEYAATVILTVADVLVDKKVFALRDSRTFTTDSLDVRAFYAANDDRTFTARKAI